MKVAVVVFPGTNCERDTVHVLRALGAEADLVWHRETDLSAFDGAVLPGGFAHGDYLRTGAIARFSPVMDEIVRMAAAGMPVVGICNGFQVLCEAGLLPGALIANRDLAFICKMVDVEVVDTGSVLTAAAMPGQRLRIPLNSYEGNYVLPDGSPRVVLRYVDDPNGSQDGAAAIANDRGNVVGIMPHPERASDALLGSSDGVVLMEGFIASMEVSHA
ncbi:MAG: phosphoribosylformylglycinamidine synthase subunit PurQ [Acidimicrobiia bacterium]|nr:phosphoribosylformylglycinamidine synthase subunit PurQ [Acidimicrobiia bacterium]MDH4307324.1 phosphoribosylformylglycinamidine synthase subunit PurQ [Acidimicrobiia bacterium]MDH5292106.1 phosphoribosylformylglycinamidine synthase subunit PurQ [Acidimicrobiia bacterium]